MENTIRTALSNIGSGHVEYNRHSGAFHYSETRGEYTISAYARKNRYGVYFGDMELQLMVYKTNSVRNGYLGQSDIKTSHPTEYLLVPMFQNKAIDKTYVYTSDVNFLSNAINNALHS
jgi:hypothetical protein